MDFVAMNLSAERITVLAVDDEEEILGLFSHYFSDDELFSIVKADSVGAALEILARQEISAIVSDYLMPGTNGLEFLSLLREQGNKIPFILFTGKGCEDVVIQALNLGADFYIVKGEQPDLQFQILKKQINVLIEKNRADEALIASEKLNRRMLSQLRATLEATEEGILVVSRDGKIADFNEHFLKLWNITPADILDAPLKEFYSRIPAEIPNTLFHSEKILLEDSYLGRRFTIDCNDERVVEVFVRSQKCDDKVIGVVYSFRDITPRIRAELLLAESRERFRILFEHSPVSNMAISPDGRITEVNRAWLSMMKLSREVVIGTPFFDIVDPAAKSDYLTYIQEILKVNVKHDTELVLRDGEGAQVIVLADGSVVRDKDGIIVQIHCVLRDITFQRKTEKQLKWTESLLFEVMNLLPFGICVTGGKNLALIFQNKFFMSFWGPEISTALHLKDGTPTLKDYFDAVCVNNSSSDPGFYDFYTNPNVSCNELELPGKRVVRVLNRSLSLKDGDERIVWAFEDITRLKDQENEIRRYARKIEVLSRIISLSGRAESIPSLADLTLSALTSILQYTGGAFYLRSEKSGAFRMIANTGLSESFISETIEFSIHDYISDHDEKKPLFIHTLSFFCPDFAKRWGITGFAYLPVMCDDVLIGSIHLTCSKPQVIPLEDQEVLLGIGREIGSSLRRLEDKKKLIEERRNQNNLINTLNAAVMVIDANDHTILTVNEYLVKKTGKFRDDLIGKVFSDDISPLISSIPYDTVGIDPVSIKHSYSTDGEDKVLLETLITPGIWNGKKALLCISHDITSTVAALEQARLTEEQLNAIFVTSPFGIILFGPDDRLKEINPVAIRLLGLSAPLVLNRYRYLDDPNIPDVIKEKIKNREPVSAELTYDFSRIRKENLYHTSNFGTIRIRIIVTPVSFSNSEMYDGFYLLIEDISERHQIEHEIHSVRRKLEQILDASNDGFWFYQCNEEVVSLSSHLREILGLSPEKERIPISDCILNIHPDDREIALLSFQKLKDKEISQMSIEIRIRDPEYGWRWVYARGNVSEWDKEGHPLTNVGAITDISRRKESEQRLLESELFNRSLIANLPDYLFICDPNGKILYRNESAGRAFRSFSSDSIGKSLTDFINPENRLSFTTQIEKRINQEELSPFEMYFEQDEEHRICTVVQAFAITFDSKPATLVVLTDITERKQNEIELAGYADTLKGTIEALASANRKLNLLSNVTRHDILNQIHIVRSYLSLLMESSLSDEDERLLEKIAYAIGFIQSHIEFTRNYQEIGVHTPAWQSPQEIIASLNSAGKKIHSDLNSLEIYADPLLSKVFENLYDNAIRHGGNVTEISVHCEEQSDESLLVVWEDNGSGITEDKKEKIFDRGFGNNTGLGLFLIREILALTGISIYEFGKPGVGAKFLIVVPYGKFRFCDNIN
ncbi:hypothetical protein DLD82_08620 [Methanospirillum stamsii]|uniref:histidine kinase n=2 Tax=Methanospirillum stamsii TaxID=1277351 RepID=A0A2V2N3A1_9EURY|nr:hypothetical protein DLD82_08620 [Methanospirillum stamsii]